MMQLERTLELGSETLSLRPLERGDAEMLWPDLSNPEISRYMAWEAHTDPAQTAEFLEGEVRRRESGKGVTWAIFRDGEFCGIVSIIGVTRRHRALTYDRGELAYWLSPRRQGQGIMSEALRLVMRYCFEEMGLHKVCVSHFAVNDASRRVIERAGFRFVGVQVEEFQKDGVWHDHRLYELLASEYEGAAGPARA